MSASLTASMAAARNGISSRSSPISTEVSTSAGSIGHRAGDEGDLLEAIGPPQAAADIDRRIEERADVHREASGAVSRVWSPQYRRRVRSGAGQDGSAEVRARTLSKQVLQ